jgi:hypothetical protein
VCPPQTDFSSFLVTLVLDTTIYDCQQVINLGQEGKNAEKTTVFKGEKIENKISVFNGINGILARQKNKYQINIQKPKAPDRRGRFLSVVGPKARITTSQMDFSVIS